MLPYLTCTETELHLHYAMAALPGGLRGTVAGWMREHGINPDMVLEGTSIVRDPAAGSLSWSTVKADGSRVQHVRYGPHQWPAPFPSRLRPRPARATRKAVPMRSQRPDPAQPVDGPRTAAPPG